MNAEPYGSVRIRPTAVGRWASSTCWLALGSWVLFPGTAIAQGGEEWGYEEDYGESAYYDDGEYPALTTRIWLDRGDDPVLDRGERARLYYRTSEDAFVAIFHIDTNGTTRLVFPRSPDEDNWVPGGRDFRLVFPGSTYWVVSDDPGVGYFFSIASPEPLDFRDFDYSHYAGGWDLTNAGRRVYRDPYVAMDEFVERLIPDWEYVAYALDFSPYHVEERYEYPRFLCYDCHGFRPYASWNPYLASCTSFRVVVYDDPYFYPSTRYRGTQVVFARPVRPGLPRFGFKERAWGEAPAPLVVRRATPTGVSGPRPAGAQPSGRTPAAVRRSGAPSAAPARVPMRTRPSQALPLRRGNPTAGSPTRPTLERRAPTRTSPGSTARPPVTGSGGGGGGAVVRTPTRSSGGTPARAAPTRSSGGTPARAAPTRSSGGTPSRAAPTRSAPTRSSGGTPARAAPTRSSGGTPARAAPTRSSGGTPSRAAPTRSSGGTPARAAPTRSSGGTPARAAPTRSSGGTPARAAPTRSSGGTPARAAPTRSSGGTPARAAPTRSSGGTPARAAPTRSSGPAARPPVARSGGRSTPPPVRRGGGGEEGSGND